jgi:hypothetical protein
MAALPEGRSGEARKIRLEKAKAQMLRKQLPEANADLKLLVDELAADPAADPKALADARSAFANSQYYVTWLMRLEGFGRDEWEPEVEAARQTYKLLPSRPGRPGTGPSPASTPRTWKPPSGWPDGPGRAARAAAPIAVRGLQQQEGRSAFSEAREAEAAEERRPQRRRGPAAGRHRALTRSP